MNGKKRCKILKEIRQKIADANDIEFITSECQHKGDCLGTCPKCEAELKYLERELEKRQRLGKTVIVAGLSALIATSSVACDDWIGGRETGGDPLPPEGGYEQGLNGDIALPPEHEMMGCPLPDDPLVDVENDLSPEELTDILLGGVTRDGLLNSIGWAERHLRADESSDTFICPIDTFDLMTVCYDEYGYVIEVIYADEQQSDAVVLPEDDLP